MIVYCKTNKPGYEEIIVPFHGYNIIGIFSNFYCIKPRYHSEMWIDQKYFFTKQELREHKLNKLNERRR